MDPRANQVLELPELFAVLKRFVQSPLGEWKFDEFQRRPFLDSPQAAADSLAEIAEAMDWLRESEGQSLRRDSAPPPRFQGLRDVRTPISRLHVEGAVLEGEEIHGILDVLDRALETRSRLIEASTAMFRLAAYAEQLHDFRSVVKRLAGKVLANGEVSDSASPALERLRRQIEQHRTSVHRSLERFVRTLEKQGSLQDDYVTIRNGRLVVPVKANWKWRVEGVIHTASSTGQTVFIEPVATIELNNRLVRLLEEEQREVHRILREMTEALREHAGAIEQTVAALAALEVLFAKARFGRDFRCCIPSFAEDTAGKLSLRGARHPLLEDVLCGEDRRVVPLSLTLERGTRILVISGPNAGGKTIVLKTVGLLSLMARAGLPIPADEAGFPWFEQVLADIGDSQSIAESLSTFSAHIARIKAMMGQATPRSLVLLDELGAATDPDEGGALAVAIIEHFRQAGAITVASTHLPAPKAYAAATEGVENASVGFDEQTLSPNYRLTLGIPGQSAGIAMAQRFGLPEPIVERARQAMDPAQQRAIDFVHQLRRQVEQHEAAAADLRQAEKKLQERESKLAAEWERREQAKLRELQRKIEERLAQLQQEHEAALVKLAESGAKRRALTEARTRQARRQRETRQAFQSAASETLGRAQQPPAQQEARQRIEEGVRVRLAHLGTTGQVLRRLSEDSWEVQAGPLKVRVSENALRAVLPPADGRDASLPSRVSFKGEPRRADSLSEINVIGKTSDEARTEVDKLLDDAVLAGVDRVRVIHGYGKEVLRKTLWKMFAGHPHVSRYYQAEQQQGGAGATIVEIRS